jgi:endonuclease/exonuclease/phosphatase family metal-dependent hydrolase
MTITILSWNIQYGLGVDGMIDLARIACVARALGDADLLCLQEVAADYPEADKGRGEDQVATLAQMFPDHQPFFGAAIDRPGVARGRRRFGNLILSRRPVLAVQSHPLPRPAHASVMHMPRQALEVVVATGDTALRVVTTHFEFHSLRQRLAQTDRLLTLHAEWSAEEATRAKPGPGPYTPLPPISGTVFCGDFNFPIAEASYAAMTSSLVDAWTALYPGRPHDPTCGIYDAKQWPQGAHARDFFFVSRELAPRLSALRIDVKTDASDHQPLLLYLV